MQPGARRVRQGPRKERGQILVLFTIVLVVILAITALVVDLGVCSATTDRAWRTPWTPGRWPAGR